MIGRRDAEKAPAHVVKSNGQIQFRISRSQTQAVEQASKGPTSNRGGQPGSNPDQESQNSILTTHSGPLQSPMPQGAGPSSHSLHYHHTYSSQLDGFYYPLPADNLLTLIHFNAFRGLTSNKSVIEMSAVMIKCPNTIGPAAITALCDGLTMMTIGSQPFGIPPALRPTRIQQSIGHSSWMNMFPCARIRDNLITMQEEFNHYDLLEDTFGEIFPPNGIPQPGPDVPADLTRTYSAAAVANYPSRPAPDDSHVTSGRNGLIVWGNPWEVENWEITPGFMQKWGWVVEGCEELLRASNKWRMSRGEDPIVIS